MSELIIPTKVIDQQALQDYTPETVRAYLEQYLNVLPVYYPGFSKWLTERVLPGLATGERQILLEHRRGSLAGLAIVKRTDQERKLCCLRVMPCWQDRGIGLRLFERSFGALETDRPLLTLAEEQRPTFERLFDHYGFTLENTYPDYYRPRREELSYNGLIVP